MYHFKIKKQENGGYRFELGVINILIDGYSISNDKHVLSNPDNAIAYFNVNDNIYGVSNETPRYATVEALYEALNQQYKTVVSPVRRSA
jgi:hypothetical protein